MPLWVQVWDPVATVGVGLGISSHPRERCADLELVSSTARKFCFEKHSSMTQGNEEAPRCEGKTLRV